MTENKRFTYSNTYGWNGSAFRNVMNGLDEKNKELKERIKQQEELISEQAIQLDYLQDENKHMRDVLNENEQLKKGLNDDLELIGQLQKEYEQLKKELDGICKSYSDYYGMNIRNAQWYGFKGDDVE